MLSQYGKLSIVVLVFFGPALAVAALVLKKHGFGRQGGWLYLLTMSIVRIVGASLRLAADNSPNDTGLAVGAAICSSIGFVPLLLCLLGMMKRVNDGTEGRHPPARFFQILHILTTVSLILGIVAGVNSGSSDPSDINSAKAERKAAACLILAAVVFLSAIASYFLIFLRRVFPTDRLMTILSSASVPFLLVRVIFIMLVAFDDKPEFNVYAPNVWIEAFLQYLMEFIIVSLYLTIGLFSARIGPDDHTRGRGLEMALPGRLAGAYDRSQAAEIKDEEKR